MSTDSPPDSGRDSPRLVEKAFIGMAATALFGLAYPDIGAFIVATIVCTAGLGLVFWIPLWIVIGMVASLIWWVVSWCVRSFFGPR